MSDNTLGRIINEPEGTYRNSGAIGSGDINQFIQSEELWVGRKAGRYPPRKQTEALTFGIAAHCFILEGPDVFYKQFAVGGPINEKTGKPYGTDTKAFAEWSAAQGRQCVSNGDLSTIIKMSIAVAGNKDAVDALIGDPEVVYRCGYISPSLILQCRADKISESRRIIADLKTTDSLAKFRRSIFDLGYYRSAAHYREVVRLVRGDDEPFRFVFVAVEKSPPYAVGVYELDEDLLERGRLEVSSALKRMVAVKAGASPRRDPPGITMVGMPKWMRGEADEPVSVLEDF